MDTGWVDIVRKRECEDRCEGYWVGRVCTGEYLIREDFVYYEMDIELRRETVEPLFNGGNIKTSHLFCYRSVLENRLWRISTCKGVMGVADDDHGNLAPLRLMFLDRASNMRYNPDAQRVHVYRHIHNDWHGLCRVYNIARVIGWLIEHQTDKLHLPYVVLDEP